MSTDSINVGKNAQSLEISPLFDAYAGVFIHTSEEEPEIGFAAGDISGRTGRVLEMFNPWATQAIADDIFATISGWQYQPYTAQGAFVDPAAELGDAVSINDEYSGIYAQDIKFSRLMTSDISAPQSEDITHEYGYESTSDRQYIRKMAEVKASLRLNADNIEAKVSKTSPEGQTSFSWQLTDISWTISSGDKTILTASASGLSVAGQIEAESGHIGGESGFVIDANKIYKNISQFGGTQTTGVYIGTDGIQLGKNFKVDSSGNLTANNGVFNGTVQAKNITSGGSSGYLSGGAISGGSIGSSQLSFGVNNDIGSGVSGYNRVLSYWIGSYRLICGTGITVLKSFLDLSGQQQFRNVVTCEYYQ